MDKNNIGHESLKALVRTTQHTIGERSFDYMLAASDSGQLAAQIACEVYSGAGLTHPPIFAAPIFRHVDKERTIIFDNSTQATNFPEWQGRHFGRALFIDDEIWRGNTLNGMLDLIMALNVQLSELTVIAEDGGFTHSGNIRGISLQFTPPKKRVPEIYNAFSYTVPAEHYWPVKRALHDEPDVNHKQVMCTLLGLPVKDRINNMPSFSARLLEKAGVAMPDFASHQKLYGQWLRQTILGYMEN